MRKLLKYSSIASAVLLVGSLVMIEGLMKKDLGFTMMGIGALIFVLVTLPTVVICIVKEVITRVKQFARLRTNAPSSNIESPDVASEDSDIEPTSADSRLEPNTWYFEAFSVFVTDADGIKREVSFDAFESAWREKQKHWFFDKKIRVRFEMSEGMSEAWEEAAVHFTNLKSRSMYFVTGSESYQTRDKKKSGGATSGIDTDEFTLRRKTHKSVTTSVKPLTFGSKTRAIYIYPAFALIDWGGARGLVPVLGFRSIPGRRQMVGYAPRDAKVTGHTWKYVNVSGPNKGLPDKRHKDNEKLDEYSMDQIEFLFKDIEFRTELRLSKPDCAIRFAHALARFQFSGAIDESEDPLGLKEPETEGVSG